MIYSTGASRSVGKQSGGSALAMARLALRHVDRGRTGSPNALAFRDVSQGQSQDAALVNIKEAVQAYVGAPAERGSVLAFDCYSRFPKQHSAL